MPEPTPVEVIREALEMMASTDVGHPTNQAHRALDSLEAELAEAHEALERIAHLPLDEDSLWDNHHPLLVPHAVVLARAAISRHSPAEEPR